MGSRHFVPVVAGVVLTASLLGCSAAPAPPSGSAVGTSELAPDQQDEADRKERKERRAGREGRKDREPVRSDAATPRGPRPTKAGATTRPARATAAVKPVRGPLSASVRDASGDVRGALTRPPAHADVTGARLTRDGGFEVRVAFAGPVPARQTDDTVVQVATFYDLDGDGETDYEAWASLADDGWGTSYRTPDGARFGADSGVRARPDGDELVLTFGLGHLESARAMSWAVGAEWGTLEQVAAGTTAKDNAPDGGWARFPG
jgi:hypothetical protein